MCTVRSRKLDVGQEEVRDLLHLACGNAVRLCLKLFDLPDMDVA